MAEGEIVPAAAARTSAAVLNVAAIVVVALYLGRELLVPIVLASLLAFVLTPAVNLLQRARLGRVAAVLLVVALAFVVIGGLGVAVGGQATSLAESLPRYKATIQHKLAALSIGGDFVEHFEASARGVLSGVGSGAALEPTTRAEVKVAPAPSTAPAAGVDASSALVIVRSVVTPLFGPLATLGVVLIFLIFIMMAQEDLRDRMVRLLGRRDLHRTILAMNDAAARLSRYFLIQLALNAGFGVFIAGGLWIAGLPNPILWGILAGLMRFIPFIGTYIALAPPLLLALAVAPGWSMALIVLALFVLSELIMGQVIEPLLYGQSTGLSPIAVIVAATFWAFLWGPVGLLIATPLTVCLVVIGRHVEPLAFLEVMLGDTPPLAPEETFYQRALESNTRQLVAQATEAVERTSLAQYYDSVAMRGLALAQDDLARDALAFERLEAIHAHIETLLTRLKENASTTPDQVLPPADWQTPGAIVCIPARGQLDDLAATMAMQVLQDAGFGASLRSNLSLGNSTAGETEIPPVKLCCLSVLEQGSNPSGIRYLLRRIERQMPGAAVVVCLWHASSTSLMLAALRSEGREETIVLSIGELLALTKAVSARK